MAKQSTKFDFGDDTHCPIALQTWHHIITDKGSKYSVTVAQIQDFQDAKEILKTIKRDKEYLQATHHSWAGKISGDHITQVRKNDDGETGAGMVILRILEYSPWTNILVIVTRWWGGVKLMNKRFLHIQDATKFALKQLEVYKKN